MMHFAWLQRLLGDRGIDARFTRELRLVSDTHGLMWLDIELDAVDEAGRPVFVFKNGAHQVATEHRLVPVAGMVFEPCAS